MGKALDAARARDAARKAREIVRKGAIGSTMLPASWRTARKKTRRFQKFTSLRVIPQAAPAKQGRDRKNQAILPLKEKTERRRSPLQTKCSAIRRSSR